MKINPTIKKTSFRGVGAAVCLILFLVTGCKKYLSLPLPVDSISGAGAYSNDAAVAAVLNGIYQNLLTRDNGNLDGRTGLAYYSGLYTDELQNVNPANIANQLFYTDAIQSTQTSLIWTDLYRQVYSCNLAVEGVQAATGLNNKNQWLGEALFIRSLIYFYLVNVYGDVPLAISSNYIVNNSLSRAPVADVYKQIIADLVRARGLLSTDYRTSTGATTTDRGRPNRLAAAALLARVYLYNKDWLNAGLEADSVITDSRYHLVSPDQVFLTASPENIWGLVPLKGGNTNAASAYLVTPGTTPVSNSVDVALSASLVSSFEPGDSRYTNWVGVSNVPAQGSLPAITYYFTNKYKEKTPAPTPAECIMLLRLAEQYLIRAEACAQQGDITGAKADLDVVRARAGLTGTAAAIQADMLAAIMQERRVELFTELGNRFFDLKRTGAIDAVMGVAAPLKNGHWASYMQFWPIPTADILVDPNLKQTPGYQE